MKFVLCAGARPNFVKVAPLLEVFGDKAILVHTGQHYSDSMSGSFFRELGIPEPAYNLGVGSGTHAQQTAAVMLGFEEVLNQIVPDAVMVVGDVNSTIGCALTAAKMGIPVFHIEAGLRSGDRGMPEEVNRVVVDHLSTELFVSEQAGLDNLESEGIGGGHFVGNVMIDTLLKFRPTQSEPQNYAVLTIHRQENLGKLPKIMEAIAEIAKETPVVWPKHPRVQAVEVDGLTIAEPMGYRQFTGLIANSRLVLTDSGGVQEETTVLGVPCLTLRENTERPCTVEIGTNRLVGTAVAGIIEAYHDVKDGVSGAIPPLWDGHTAERIADIVNGS